MTVQYNYAAATRVRVEDHLQGCLSYTRQTFEKQYELITQELGDAIYRRDLHDKTGIYGDVVPVLRKSVLNMITTGIMLIADC